MPTVSQKPKKKKTSAKTTTKNKSTKNRKRTKAKATLTNKGNKGNNKPKRTRQKGKKRTSVAIPNDREVIYGEIAVSVADGNDAITVTKAKELLGWEPETEEVSFGNDYLLKDTNGKKVRCHHNIRNRPIYSGVLDTLKQEHLRRRWRLNGEPIIIGRTGLVLNGQHTLMSLILAAQEWENNKDTWSTYWKSEPTMEKVVIVGVDESDDTVNTMDTCKPRSLADVIYRSNYFADKSKIDIKKLATITSYAVRKLWERTGASWQAHAPRRTHSEALDFLSRHERLLEAVKHVFEENGKENRLQKYCTPGYAAGLLYLMATSTTDPAGYVESENPNESQLDFSRWDQACEFWLLLAAGAENMRPLRSKLARGPVEIQEEEDEYNRNEKMCVLIKGWNRYVKNQPIREKDLKLNYVQDKDGFYNLDENPTVGGIDLGQPKPENV